MVIFEDKERLPHLKKQLEQLQSIQELFDVVKEKSVMRDSYNALDQLIPVSDVERFSITIQDSLESKVLEIYHLEQKFKSEDKLR